MYGDLLRGVQSAGDASGLGQPCGAAILRPRRDAGSYRPMGGGVMGACWGGDGDDDREGARDGSPVLGAVWGILLTVGAVVVVAVAYRLGLVVGRWLSLLP